MRLRSGPFTFEAGGGGTGEEFFFSKTCGIQRCKIFFPTFSSVGIFFARYFLAKNKSKKMNKKCQLSGLRLVEKYTSRKMPIVLGTFTSSSTKFVDLSYYAQSCRDSMKAL